MGETGNHRPKGVGKYWLPKKRIEVKNLDPKSLVDAKMAAANDKPEDVDEDVLRILERYK
jgi:hypothetical protein